MLWSTVTRTTPPTARCSTRRPCCLDPDIFGILERTAPGAGGEIQLTDAMRAVARTRGMMALDFEGKRFDIGNKLSYLMANVEVALKNPDYGDKFRDYLKGLKL